MEKVYIVIQSWIFMSTWKFITGQPGNIEEFAEMVKGSEHPIKMVVHTWSVPIQNYCETWHGKVIYSSNKTVRESSKRKIRFVSRPGMPGGGIFAGGYNRREIITDMLDQQGHNLGHLSRSGINVERSFCDDGVYRS